MNHCVGRYAHRCANNQSAIVSLRCNNAKAVTLELDTSTLEVIQARGKYNQLPSAPQKRITELWHRSVVKTRKQNAEDPGSILTPPTSLLAPGAVYDL